MGHHQVYQHTLIGVPKEERKGQVRIAEEIVAENFSSLMKNMSINMQDGQ